LGLPGGALGNGISPVPFDPTPESFIYFLLVLTSKVEKSYLLMFS